MMSSAPSAAFCLHQSACKAKHSLGGGGGGGGLWRIKKERLFIGLSCKENS